MNPLILGRLSVLLSLPLILVMGCTGKGDPADTESLGNPTESPASIRFAIEVDGNVAGPIYVALNDEDDQLGWVKASLNGRRVYFKERCDIEDCGAPAAVCGAAIPHIKDIAVGGRSIEGNWNGMTSQVDPVSGCESRRPAPLGNYIARFCYSDEAEFEGDDMTGAVPGRLIRPTCIEMPFTLQERQVVFRIVRKR